MRCKKCNVDLPESYKTCPLCGEKASNEQTRLGGIAYVPYSTSLVAEPKSCKKEKADFSREMLKAYFNL